MFGGCQSLFPQDRTLYLDGQRLEAYHHAESNYDQGLFTVSENLLSTKMGIINPRNNSEFGRR